MPVFLNFRISDELHQRIVNYQLRERRSNKSEAVRILLEDALELSELKAQGPDAAARTIMDPELLAKLDAEAKRG